MTAPKCPEDAVALPAELAAWTHQIPLVAATRQGDLGKAEIVVGQAVLAEMKATPEVTYSARPADPGGKVSKGGMFQLVIKRAGLYRVAIGDHAWIDDADLSVNGTMSCATCHEQKNGFADGNRTHAGVTGEPGKRNVPGLANVASFRNLTRADNHLTGLEEQALIPILGTAPVEMGVKGHEDEVVARFATDPCYARLFAAAFPKRRGEVSLETALKGHRHGQSRGQGFERMNLIIIDPRGSECRNLPRRDVGRVVEFG